MVSGKNRPRILCASRAPLGILILLLIFAPGGRKAFGQSLGSGVTNVVVDIKGRSTKWAFPSKIQMPIDTPLGMTYQDWKRKYGIFEQGGPIFSGIVDTDATMYHGSIVSGFPNPLISGYPSILGTDANSCFLALKPTGNGYCKTWVSISVKANRSGTTWYYQLRYFSGDPIANIAPRFEIGVVPGIGNYSKTEDVPIALPNRVQTQRVGIAVRTIELIQSIQDWSATIPLVQNKRTYARVHFQNNTSADVNVRSVSLRGFYPYGTDWKAFDAVGLTDKEKPSTGLAVKPYDPNKGPTSRTNWQESLNFLLPYKWTTNLLMLQLVGSGMECEAPVFAQFEKVQEMNWNFVRTRFPSTSVPQTLLMPDAVTILGLYSNIHAMYPLPDNPNVRHKPKFFTQGIPGNPLNSSITVGCPKACKPYSWSYVLALLLKYVSCNGTGRDLWYSFVAWEPVKTNYVAGKAAGIGGCAAAGFLAPGDNRNPTLAHEVGHMLRRPHTTLDGFIGSCTETAAVKSLGQSATEIFPYYAPGPAGITWPFLSELGGPFPPNLEYSDLIIALDTTDPNHPALVPLEQGAEIMSYISLCTSKYNPRPPYKKWLSKQNYLDVLSEIQARLPHTYSRLDNVSGDMSEDVFLVAGVIDLVGPDTYLLPVEKISTTSPTAPAPGPYSVQLLGSDGTVLVSVPFDVTIPPLEPPEDEIASLSFAVPVPAIPGARGIQLLKADQVIAQITASANAPVVHVLQPAQGDILADEIVSFSWTGTDADNDPLTYRLDLSYDGGVTWNIVASDLSTSSVSVERNLLTASTNALWRITASDGFNNSTDISSGSFVIQGPSPALLIHAPVEGSSFATNDSIVLFAGPADPSTQPLGETEFAWKSDVNGPLGTGNELLIGAANLKLGQHAISVTAVDPSGIQLSNVVHVTIGEVTSVPQLLAELARGAVILSWPSDSSGFALQQSESLGPQAHWTLVDLPVQALNGRNTVNLQVGLKNRFFRLTNSPP